MQADVLPRVCTAQHMRQRDAHKARQRERESGAHEAAQRAHQARKAERQHKVRQHHAAAYPGGKTRPRKRRSSAHHGKREQAGKPRVCQHGRGACERAKQRGCKRAKRRRLRKGAAPAKGDQHGKTAQRLLHNEGRETDTHTPLLSWT